MIQVCLVDDQTLVRQGIRSLLELSDSIRVIAEAGDGVQAVETIPRVKPDVVLLDMRMPGMSGLDVLNALAAKNELPPTIILTTFDDDQLVLAGLKAGARGYLLKDVSLDQLVDAVKTVADGGSLVAPMVTQRLLSGLERMAVTPAQQAALAARWPLIGEGAAAASLLGALAASAPATPELPAILLRVARDLRVRGDAVSASHLLERIVATWPASGDAAKARMLLTEAG